MMQTCSVERSCRALDHWTQRSFPAYQENRNVSSGYRRSISGQGRKSWISTLLPAVTFAKNGPSCMYERCSGCENELIFPLQQVRRLREPQLSGPLQKTKCFSNFQNPVVVVSLGARQHLLGPRTGGRPMNSS